MDSTRLCITHSLNIEQKSSQYLKNPETSRLGIFIWWRYTVPPTGTQKQPYERNAPYFFIFAHHPVCKHSVCLCRRYTVPPTGTQKQPYERDVLYFFIYPPPYSQARRGGYMKKQPHGFRKVVFSLVPAVGLEPTRMISPQDFESSASASFTTPAQVLIYHNQALLATDFVKKLQIELKFMPQVTLCVLNYLKFCLNKCDRRCTIVL